MLIAEDLLLLLYDDESGKPITGAPGLDYGLAGAVLIELTMLGKLDVAGEGEEVKRGGLKVLDAAVDKKALKQRAKEIAESDWAADAVKKAVTEMQAAVTTAIVVSATAASTGG